MKVTAITRHFFTDATTKSGDKKVLIYSALNFDFVDYYLLTTKPNFRSSLNSCTNEKWTSYWPNTYNGRETEFEPSAEFTNFSNRISFKKHFDGTLKLIGKAITYDIKHSNDS